MKRITTIATVLLLGAPPVLLAEVSGSVALTTDYVFRGISQTDENPAIQGGFDYAHSSGLYIGTWASNVDFGDGGEANMELDVYGGYSGTVQKLGYDVGLIHYDYPGASSSLNYGYNEVYGKLSYDFGVASATVGINHSNDYFASSGNATYYFADVEIPLPHAFSVAAHVGHQSIDDNDAFGTPDYTNYKIGVSTQFQGFGFSLDWIDTDLKKSECFGGSDLCDSRVVFSVSRSL